MAGIDVVAQPSLVKQIIGIVSQENTLDRQLTVWENLYMHGRLFGVAARESRRITDQLLEQFQLSRFAKASVYALSGGMAQRASWWREAIFHRPAVLFLDEPTGRARSAKPPPRFVGDLARAQYTRTDNLVDDSLHGRGRPVVSPPSRSWITGNSSALGTPAQTQTERRARTRSSP